jgi:hypothetical protein
LNCQIEKSFKGPVSFLPLASLGIPQILPFFVLALQCWRSQNHRGFLKIEKYILFLVKTIQKKTKKIKLPRTKFQRQNKFKSTTIHPYFQFFVKTIQNKAKKFQRQQTL